MRAGALALLALAGCAAPQSDRAWDPASVNPAWLELLLTSLADTEPVVAAVDLDGAAESERFTGTLERREESMWYRDPDTGGYFVSRYLGCTPRGTHVFEVSCCYGGSGVFGDLLFVAYEEDWLVSEGTGRKRRVLRSLGSWALGDRFAGALHLVGNSVRVRQTDGRHAVVVVPPEAGPAR